MGDELGWWQTLTEPQATVLSGVLTIIAAITAAFLAARLFRNEVSDLKGALEKSRGLVEQHVSAIEPTLKILGESVRELRDQSTSLVEAMGQMRGVVGDLQANALEGGGDGQENPDVINDRDQFVRDWNRIRDRLEEIAADQLIDGRTKARYARIDRRRYLDLVNALAEDRRLGQHADQFRQAVALWQQHRNGRAALNDQALNAMSGFSRTLVPV